MSMATILMVDLMAKIVMMAIQRFTPMRLKFAMEMIKTAMVK